MIERGFKTSTMSRYKRTIHFHDELFYNFNVFNIASHVNFLTLPREVRDQIYKLSLISPSPVVVWSEELSTKSPDEARKRCTHVSRYGSRRNIERENTKLSLGHMAWNSLKCNKVIRHEVAPILYRKNTFRFLDEHNRDPMLEWLTAIGPENRNFQS